MNQTKRTQTIRIQKTRKFRRKSGSPSRQYFTKVHENAILEYVATNDIRRRTELYRDYIGPVFDEMVDKIVYTYKFTTLPNIDSLRSECKIWLVTILDKYNPEKSKAFSYFSVVTKNWFIGKVKKKSKRNRQELDIMELPNDLELRHVSTINPYLKERAVREFWTLLTEEIESWDNQEKMKENEKKVLAAVQILMESCEDIEIFNKKAIYLYLREITGLNTKQVVNNLNKMRIKYRSFKVKWNSGDL